MTEKTKTKQRKSSYYAGVLDKSESEWKIALVTKGFNTPKALRADLRANGASGVMGEDLVIVRLLDKCRLLMKTRMVLERIEEK